MEIIEGKLSSLEDAVIDEAERKKASIVSMCKSRNEETIRKRKEEIDKEAREVIAAYEKEALEEKAKLISAAIMNKRKILQEAKQQLINKTFEEVESKVLDFINTDYYLEFLEDCTISALRCLDSKNVTIYLMERDIEKFKGVCDSVYSQFQSIECEIVFAEEDIIGGVIVGDKIKGKFVDNSLRQKLEDIKEKLGIELIARLR